jgi:hypothetical protein
MKLAPIEGFHDFVSLDDMSRAPQFRQTPGRWPPPRPEIPPPPQSDLPGLSLPPLDFENVIPHYAHGLPRHVSGVSDEWDSSESDADYGNLSENETRGNPREEDENDQQDFDPEDYDTDDLVSSSFSHTDPCCSSSDSDFSSSVDEGWPASRRHRGTQLNTPPLLTLYNSKQLKAPNIYLPGTLEGIVDGVTCTFKPQGGSHELDTTAPWFPYTQYPSAFRWSCCGAGFNEPVCSSPRTVIMPRCPFMQGLWGSRRADPSHGPDYDGDLDSSVDRDQDDQTLGGQRTSR